MKITIHYAPLDWGMEFQDSWPIETIWDPDELGYIAEECAEDYHNNHDGWEASWPVTFVMWDHRGEELGTCEVSRETAPVFQAAPKSIKVNKESIKE
jgi:hypothetical protein